MSLSERHAIEKAALDDPFLAEALEGYATVDTDPEADLQELRARLEKERTRVIPLRRGGASPGYHWLRIAAMVVLLAGAGWLVFEFGFNQTRPEIAQSKNSEAAEKPSLPPQEMPKPILDSTSPTGTPSSTVVEREKTNSTAGTGQKPAKTADHLPPASTEVAAPPVTTQPAMTEPRADDAIALEEKSAALERQREKEKDRQIAAKSMEQQSAAARKISPPQGNAFYNNMNVFRGQITDDQNNALPFVNITNTRDNVGTYTDARGNFTLVSPDSVLDVQIRSLGYENTRTTLKNEVASNHVSLQEDKAMTARVLDTVKRNLNRARGNTMKLEEPEPADGWDYYDTYLVNNLNVPEVYEVKKRTTGGGEVELSFEVNRAGEPVNIVVEKSLCDPCDKEAIRLVKEGPRWKYKKKNGRTRVMVPFY